MARLDSQFNGAISMTKKQTVTSGEERLIERYFRPLAKHPGAFDLVDDAAALAPPAGCDLVLTVDGIVGGVHFFPDDPADAVAKKALRVNLSDLAAKGARPLGFLLTLALPEEIGERWLASFARGLGEDADTYDCSLFGGDTVRTPGPVTISIAAFGAVPHGRMVRRGGARPGDRVVVTGTIGDAALGLLLRRDPATGKRWGLDRAGAAITSATRYLLPQPRTAIADADRRIRDRGDGRLRRAGRRSRPSSAALPALRPRSRSRACRCPMPRARRSPAKPALIETILTGGDDYEVLATVPARKVAALRRQASAAGVAVTEIGTVTAGKGTARFLDRDGKRLAFAHPSFSHF